eukprot:TRINITY_DN48912_c0_g1_i1.p1 TRINITY_DN48912_c0_g1~~TRINITY_DN48912_c0_g1_i1.p1  ORF type:complete len:919 (-),score=187.35 TRINITY_DN48912_c0_g1_i1:55-2781(-)
MIVGSRHVPVFDEETLEGMTKQQVAMRATALADYLGRDGFPEVPRHKASMIQWILKHQQLLANDNATTRENKLLSSHLHSGLGNPNYAESMASSVTQMDPTSPYSQPRGGNRKGNSSQGMYASLQDGSSAAGTWIEGDDPRYEAASMLMGSPQRAAIGANVTKRVESPAYYESTKNLSTAARNQAHRSRTAPKSEEQGRTLRQVIKTVLMGGDPITAVQLDELMEAFVMTELKAGDVVVKEGETIGDSDPGLFVLESGELSVHKAMKGSTGYGPKVFSYTKAGSVMGEIAFLYGSPRAATLVAEGDVQLWSMARVNLNAEVNAATARRRKRHMLLLAKVPILAGIREEQAQKALFSVEVVRRKRGDVVFSQGHMGNQLFIIEQGACMSVRQRETLSATTLKHYKSGDCFGELALLQDVPRAADVIVESQTVVLISIDRSKLVAVVGPPAIVLKRTPEEGSPSRRRRQGDDDDAMSCVSGSTSCTWMSRAESRADDMRSTTASSWVSGAVDRNGHSTNYAAAPKAAGHPVHLRQRTVAEATNMLDGRVEQPRPPGHAIGKVMKMKAQDADRLAQEMLSMPGFFGHFPPSNSDLSALAATFTTHFVEAGIDISKEGEHLADEDTVFIMLLSGNIGSYKANSSSRTFWKAAGRPVTHHGVRMSFYEKDKTAILGNAVILNNAVAPTTLVADQRSNLVSVSREVLLRVTRRSIEERRKGCFDLFSRIPCFSSLDDAEVERLVDIAGIYHFQKGDLVLKSGEVGNILFVIERGACASYQKGKLVKQHHEGSAISEDALIEDCFRAADVVVESREATLLGICRKDFNRTLGKLVIRIGDQSNGESSAPNQPPAEQRSRPVVTPLRIPETPAGRRRSGSDAGSVASSVVSINPITGEETLVPNGSLAGRGVRFSR